MRWLSTLLLLAALAAAGCTNFWVADIAVNQGNEAQISDFDKVSLGMSQKKVRALLGPPQTRWELEEEIWIYYYQRRDAKTDERLSGQITFADGKVSKIEKLDPRGGSE